MSTHILGVRHHGPGSARNVKQFLEQTKPDIILVEGPPDAETLLQWVAHADMIPPVALLVYQPDKLERSVFFPFAEFSPEWQAILYALKNKIHIRFMDLPMMHAFALMQEMETQAKNETVAAIPVDGNIDQQLKNNVKEEFPDQGNGSTDQQIYADPMSYLAEAAGMTDGEKWWEQFIEHRHNNEEIFEAVAEAITTLRGSFPTQNDRDEQLREAWMRKIIRQAEKEMFSNIAVICGAWHVPALTQMPKAKDDNELLKGLPKVKVECTWIPWTYSRLSYYSGYGAGINSPGWYEHIWKHPNDDGTYWMAGVAKLFREKGMDTSVAHVIEAVRLAESLASLRGLSKVGLMELNEATLSVLCNGEIILMQLIEDELIVSNKLGSVPGNIPKPPLQADIESTQKRLRLHPAPDTKEYTLDMRNETDLARSVFLHRLLLLGIEWGTKGYTGGKGTFKEMWRLKWVPSLSVDIIEKGNWGNTVEAAASAYIRNIAMHSISLKEVSDLLADTIAAELSDAVNAIIQSIHNLAASSGDVLQLMDAIPGLVNVVRYGNVRKTNTDMVMGIAKSIITRICISLPAASLALDDDASQQLVGKISRMDDALNILQDEGCSAEWLSALLAINNNNLAAPVVAGYATRLLFDHKTLIGDELKVKFAYAMSPGNRHEVVSAWLEGFLKGSGMVLLLDDDLWTLINQWVISLNAEAFNSCLPVLRRTFANFTAPERKKLGEKAKNGSGQGTTAAGLQYTDHERGLKGIPVVLQLLGLKMN